MNMEHDILLVEKYFDRELSEAETVEFNDRLKSDQSFKALVEQEKILITTIRQEGLAKDLQYLKSVEHSLGRKKNSFHLGIRNLRWQYAAAAAITTLLVTVGLWMYLPQESSQELFEAYFKPHSNVFEPTTVRGSATLATPRTEAFQSYENGDYQKAAELFTALVKEKPEPGMLLLLGNANLILGNIDEAEKNFITLNKDFDELDLQAQWYLSLCYLKTGDVESARKILKELGATDISYAAKAKELLQKVDD